MLPVPDASRPAVEICSETSAELPRFRIVVDHLAEAIDQLDDHLRRPVAGRRLARKKIRARRGRLYAVVHQPQVLMHDPQRHQQLALVFVDTLGLYIEHRRGIDVHGGESIYDSRQPLLVSALDCSEPALKLDIVSEFLDCAQLLEVGAPSHADRRVEQTCETGIRHQQPSPLRDAVGFVGELFRPQLIEVRHQPRLDEFRVQL
jgi:hypothetical protein